MESVSALVLLILFFFFIILVILWVTLPFLLVGTNKRLTRLISLMDENNNIQEDIRADINRLAGEAEKTLNR